jgi:predicted enzyme related to lactoylglutathione lyase
VKPPILQLRVALTAKDYEAVFAFYHEALGLDPAQDWSTEQARGLMFEMGRASLEIFDEAYASNVDQVEVGKRVSGPIRFALQVPDLDAALKRLTDKGATVLHEPVITPWGDRNVRVQAPDGMQITLFQVPGG